MQRLHVIDVVKLDVYMLTTRMIKIYTGNICNAVL